MAMTEQEAVAAKVVQAKGRSPLMAVLVVALLLVSGVCAYALVELRAQARTGAAAAAGDDVAAAKGQPEFFLPLDPAFVVNFRDDEAMRYLQVGVTLMSHDQATLDTVKGIDPVVRNALVMLFSRQEYAILTDPKGKQKLQAEALEAVRRIVAARTGKPGIDALYFTSFVMQ